MKKSLVLACSALALGLALSSTAEARDGFYLTARGGMTWNNFNSKKDAISDKKVTKLDHVGVYSGAVGYKYKYFRGEFEYVWRADAEESISTAGNPSAEMTVSSKSYMFNEVIYSRRKNACCYTYQHCDRIYRRKSERPIKRRDVNHQNRYHNQSRRNYLMNKRSAPKSF